MSGDREPVGRALAAARQAGAVAADALLVESDALEARVRAGEIDFVKQARERTLGIRAFVEGGHGLRQALTSTGDLRAEAVDRMAREAVTLACATAADPAAGLPGETLSPEIPDLELFEPGEHPVDAGERIREARRAEAAARATDARITNSEGTQVRSGLSRTVYASSSGFLGAYTAASHTLLCMPIASRNGSMQRDYWMTAGRRLSALEDAASVGRCAAERAVRRLGARSAPTGEVPVIFEPLAARSLLGNLAACVNGYSVYREASFLAGRVGQPIASRRVQVIDDGRLPGGLGSRPFDGEGLPTRRTRVIEEGRLAAYLLDSYSARKLGMRSTGNAARGATRPPGVSPTNLWLEPGDSSLEEIIRDTPRGLLVSELIGMGFNPVTGDYSRGAAGVWIEGGRLAWPAEEITIAGNLGRMLQGIDAIGNDLLRVGSTASPSIRVRRMTVAGR